MIEAIVSGGIVLAVIAAALWVYYRGRASQQLDDAKATNKAQKGMLDDATNLPRDVAGVAKRLRDGDF